jgi:ADP-heptose:LPS heptosyltransferase
LPIRVSAALIERATLMIGLNSGPTHVAAAVKSPALVLIRPDIPGYSEERKWLPSGDNIFSLQIRPDILSGKMDWGRILAVQQAREHLTHMRGAPVI